MDMNRLTEKAQAAIAAAQRDAEQRHNTQLEPEHLLAALVKQESGVVRAVLEKLGVPPRELDQRLETILAASRAARASSRRTSRRRFAGCSTPPPRKPSTSKTTSSVPSTFCWP